MASKLELGCGLRRIHPGAGPSVHTLAPACVGLTQALACVGHTSALACLRFPTQFRALSFRGIITEVCNFAQIPIVDLKSRSSIDV